MKFLDANIILRYVTDDSPSESVKCERCLASEKLFTSTLVIAEVLWVLFSAYKFPKPKVTNAIQRILNSPNIYLDDKDLVLSALDIFEANNIDFIDAYNAALMGYKGIGTIYSDDKHYDSIPKIKRIQP